MLRGDLDFLPIGRLGAIPRPLTDVEVDASSGGQVTLPSAHLLFQGTYHKKGFDLVIEDGANRITLHDYFRADKRPVLKSPEGASLSDEVISALAVSDEGERYAQATPPAAVAPIGRVETVSGSANAVRNGVSVTLNQGDLVFRGDTVSTDRGSSLGITFIDGTTFSLASSARMVLNEMVYNPGGQGNSALISLVQGSITFLAGQVAKTGDMRVDTPVATMGIRGTLVKADIDANNGLTNFSVLTEPSGVTGSFVLLNRTTGAVIGTVSQAGFVTAVAPDGSVSTRALSVAEQQDQALAAAVVFQVFSIGISTPIPGGPGIPGAPAAPGTPGGGGGGGGGSSTDPTINGGASGGAPNGTGTGGQVNPGGSNVPAPVPPGQNTAPNPLGNQPNASIVTPQVIVAGSPVVTTSNGSAVIPVDNGAGLGQGSANSSFSLLAQTIAVQPNEIFLANQATQNGLLVSGGSLEAAASANVVSARPGGLEGVGAEQLVAGANPTIVQGQYGYLAIRADGTYFYVATRAAPLGADVHGLDTFTYTAQAADGTRVSQTVSFDVTGVNDAPTAASYQIRLPEDALVNSSASASGQGVQLGSVLAQAADPDTGDAAQLRVSAVHAGTAADASVAAGGSATVAGAYGTLTLRSDGSFEYRANNADRLAQDVVGTDTFTYTIVDTQGAIATATMSFSVVGINDAAIIALSSYGAVTEASGIANALLGTPAITGTATSTDIDGPANVFRAASGASASGYGSFTVDAGGRWTFTLDNANAAVQALNVGGTLTDTFVIRSDDGTEKTVSVTINGANDAAVIAGDATGRLVEAGGVANASAGTPTVAGTLTVQDVDNPGSGFTAASGVGQNGYGTYAIDAAGRWTFTLDNANAAVQALNIGQTLADTFTVRATDGTEKTVTVTIDGANDAATIGGALTGTVTEAGTPAAILPGIPTVAGTLTATDVDNPANAFTAASGTSVAGYGTYAIDATGRWVYTLDNANTAVQALNTGQSLTDTFVVRSIDGTAETVTVTIQGTTDLVNRAPETASVSVTANEDSLIAVQLSGTDPDVSGSVASFTITSVTNGAVYLDPAGTVALPASGIVPAILSGATVYFRPTANYSGPASFLYAATDDLGVTDATPATASITIAPVNDPAVITGTTLATVIEAGTPVATLPGIPTAAGTLTALDVDNPPNTFTAASGTSVGGYGSYTIDASGHWVYTLDNANTAVQALNTGQSLIDTFVVRSVDGTPQTITITIQGTTDLVNQPAETASVSVTGNEDMLIAVQLSGTDPDVGGSVASFTVSAATNGAVYLDPAGTVALGPTGVVLAVQNGATVYFRPRAEFSGQASFIYTATDNLGATDATPATVSITVTPVNDPAVIAGTTTGAVVEAGTPATALPGIPLAEGILTAADIDDPSNTFTAASGPSLGGYGSYTIDASGRWVYTLDNGNTAVQALNTGDALIDTFVVNSIDGTPQTITITINGTTDVINRPPETASVSVTGNEDTLIAVQLSATDPDVGGSVAFFTIRGVTNGAIYLDPAGTVPLGPTVTAVSNGATVYFWPDTNYNGPASFTYAATDNLGATDMTPATVSITVTPVNDPAVIAGTTIGAVAEAGTPATALPGIPIAEGILTAADIDNPPNTFTAGSGASAGGYGSYTIDATGHWVYTLDNSNTAVQALNTGQSLVDTFVVRSIDGTPQTITITIDGTTDVANTPPVVDLNGGGQGHDGIDNAVQYGNSSVYVAANADVFDSDSTAIRSATIDLIGGQGDDSIDIVFGGQGGSHGLAVTRSGTTITLTGNASASVYEDAIQDIVFHAGSTATSRSVQVAVTVTDSDGATSAVARSTVQITATGGSGGGTAPTTAADVISASEDGSTPVSASTLLANDTGNALQITGVGPADHGTVAISGNGIVYTPGSFFQSLQEGGQGSDGFDYTVTDASGQTAIGHVAVAVQGRNDAPTANDDPRMVVEGSSVLASTRSAGVLGNDRDPDGDVLRVSAVRYEGSNVGLNAAAQALVASGNTLQSGLGGSAGFGEGTLPGNDDGSTSAITITSIFGPNGLNFFGQNFTTLFINNNGNVTFTSALSAYVPSQIQGSTSNPIIAPFWYDIDTRVEPSGLVYWDLNTDNHVFTATWDHVGYYSGHTDALNSFQLQLVDEGSGDFDIIFRYSSITNGGYSDTTSAARAGYSAGQDGTNSYELLQSGNVDSMAMLDTTPGNTAVTGVYVFQVRNGQVSGADQAVSDGSPTVIHGTYGTLSLKGDGTYTYQADNTASLGAGQHGADRFLYTVSDGHGGAAQARLVFDVTGVDGGGTTQTAPNASGGNQPFSALAFGVPEQSGDASNLASLSLPGGRAPSAQTESNGSGSVLVGSDGPDVFVLSASAHDGPRPTILNFDVGSDAIDISNLLNIFDVGEGGEGVRLTPRGGGGVDLQLRSEETPTSGASEFETVAHIEYSEDDGHSGAGSDVTVVWHQHLTQAHLNLI